LTANGDDLPNNSRVVRYVPYARMEKDENDQLLRPYPNAFERRAVDEELSVTWCEFFAGAPNQQLRCAIEAIRNSKLDVKSRACFCVAETPRLLDTIQIAGGQGRAIYLPEDGNEAHAGITGIDPENALLLQCLADEVWCEFYTKATADALPTGECVRSTHEFLALAEP